MTTISDLDITKLFYSFNKASKFLVNSSPNFSYKNDKAAATWASFRKTVPVMKASNPAS